MKTINKNKLLSNMFSLAPGVWGRKDVFVNFYMVQNQLNTDWVLVDAGLKWSAKKIKEMAAFLFGSESRPTAIILTHGHFDHVGSVTNLADEWQTPVYAHHLEIPYLTGQSNYPPPDSTVGGGLMASTAFLYPNKPINIWRHLKVLPGDGTIPVLPEWNFIHTPGHSPGHISLFRDSDKVLIAGDAFTTTKQESLLSVISQKKELSGPPKQYTCDWQAAKNSVEKLVKLNPAVAGTGHGVPMFGMELKKALTKLSNNFYKKAVPAHGRYVPYPAITDANGVVHLPKEIKTNNHMAIKAFGVTALLALGVVYSTYRKRQRKIAYDNFIDVEYNY